MDVAVLVRGEQGIEDLDDHLLFVARLGDPRIVGRVVYPVFGEDDFDVVALGEAGAGQQSGRGHQHE